MQPGDGVRFPDKVNPKNIPVTTTGSNPSENPIMGIRISGIFPYH
jgi:hypothetical protein